MLIKNQKADCLGIFFFKQRVKNENFISCIMKLWSFYQKNDLSFLLNSIHPSPSILVAKNVHEAEFMRTFFSLRNTLSVQSYHTMQRFTYSNRFVPLLWLTWRHGSIIHPTIKRALVCGDGFQYIHVLLRIYQFSHSDQTSRHWYLSLCTICILIRLVVRFICAH